jgi:putative phage-type endonuclease
MQVLSLIQGSQEWKAARLQHFTASEAPAMLGLSKYQTRTALLAMKKSGIAEDIAPATQALFDRGHAAEASARAIAERIIGEVLYPCTGRAEVEGLPLLASFDGLTMAEDVVFEHKLHAGWLADHINQTGELPDTHWPQVMHQLIVSGAEKCLFMVSDGTEERMAYCWYEADAHPDHRAAVLSGWRQFAKDLETYQPSAAPAQAAPAPVESLPSVFVQVTGALAVTDNLQKFGDALRAFIDRTPRKPETDDEFATCDAAIKTLSKAEEALDAAESAALAQVACIDDMRTLKATLKDLARSNRLALEKLVKAEKESRRMAIVTKAQQELAFFTAAQQAGLGFGIQLPASGADLGGAIKGLKTIASIQNAVDTELSGAKMRITESAQTIIDALVIIEREGGSHAFLFADKAALVKKDPEALTLIIKSRIADHEAAQAQKLEQERARIQAEADDKAKAEADRVIEAERAKIRAEEQAKAEAEAAAKRNAEAEANECAKAAFAAGTEGFIASMQKIGVSVVYEDSEARITLGQINSRLSVVSVTADQLLRLGFEFKTDRAAKTYSASDLRKICNAIAAHVLSVPDYVEQEAA